MTPSEDIESETDDLHLWYTTRSLEMGQNRSNLASMNCSELATNSNQQTDPASVSQNGSPTETKIETNNEFKTENGTTDAKFGLNSELDGNEAVVAPKLTIDDSEGGTGQIEAVHAEKCSEAARAQHLHDSTVTTIGFKERGK